MMLYMGGIEFNREMEDIENLSCFAIFQKKRQNSTFNIDDSDFFSSSIYFFTIYIIAMNIPSHKQTRNHLSAILPPRHDDPFMNSHYTTRTPFLPENKHPS